MVRPNVAPDAQGNNFLASPNSRADVYNSHLVRVDHNFGDVRFFSRYGHNGRHEDRANAGRQDIAVTNDGHHYRWNDNLNGDLTWSIGPSMVSNLKVGWTRHERRDMNITEEFDSSTLGYADSYLDLIPRTNFMQPISINDYSGANVGSAGNGFHTEDHVYLGLPDDDEALGQAPVQGRRRVGYNIFAAGARARRRQRRRVHVHAQLHVEQPRRRPARSRPTAQGNAFASFLIGYPRSQTITLAAVPDLHFNASYTGVYVQDDWRVSDRFTLNLGLRYDYERPVSERDNLVVDGFDYTSQNPLALQCTGLRGGGGASRHRRQPPGRRRGPRQHEGRRGVRQRPVYNGDGNNFGPRVGATYQITEKMLLRGGYGKTFLNGARPIAARRRATPARPPTTRRTTTT